MGIGTLVRIYTLGYTVGEAVRPVGQVLRLKGELMDAETKMRKVSVCL